MVLKAQIYLYVKENKGNKKKILVKGFGVLGMLDLTFFRL